MKLATPFALVLSFAWLHFSTAAHAEERRAEHHEGHEGQQGHDGHEAHDPHGGARPMPPRPAPPRFQAHPPGVHPHGPTVHPHAVRVMRPTTAHYGAHPWRHWEHPEFARPVYYWDWALIHNISCTAEDSYGDQYPVTEEAFSGFGLVNMTAVEDDALDRCYQESGGDPSCYLATCSHF
jgi:hypothetical protein